MNEILLNQTNLYTRSTIFKYIDMYAPPPSNLHTWSIYKFNLSVKSLILQVY